MPDGSGACVTVTASVGAKGQAETERERERETKLYVCVCVCVCVFPVDHGSGVVESGKLPIALPRPDRLAAVGHRHQSGVVTVGKVVSLLDCRRATRISVLRTMHQHPSMTREG